MAVLAPRRKHSTAPALLLVVAILAAGLPELTGFAVQGGTPSLLTLNICTAGGGVGRFAPAHEPGLLPALFSVPVVFPVRTLDLMPIAAHSRAAQAPQPPPPKASA